MYKLYKYSKYVFILLLACTVSNVGSSQVVIDTFPADSTNGTKVRIIHADVGRYERLADKEVQELKGNVKLYQDSTFMFCDSATISDNKVSAFGSVRIVQSDSLSVFADSLEYDGDAKKAILFGKTDADVVLVSKDQKLFTNRLHYNLKTKVASYFTGATLTNQQTYLKSKKGSYYVDSEQAYFLDSVYVKDPEFSLSADSLKFNTKSQLATFIGPTRIKQKERDVYCESGFYDIANKKARFERNAQYKEDDKQATANVIIYDGQSNLITLEGEAEVKETDRFASGNKIIYNEKTGNADIIGNAKYRDAERDVVGEDLSYNDKTNEIKTKGRSTISEEDQILVADNIDYNDENGFGYASGNVIWIDTAASVVIVCDSADYNKENNYIKAYGNSRPLMKTEVDGDTLFITAEQLISQQQLKYGTLEFPDSVLTIDTLDNIGDSISEYYQPIIRYEIDSSSADTAQQVQAYKDVRIFKSDMQAICDSLVYNDLDSIFYFYENPVIWKDTSQFSADTILVYLVNDKIDKIDMIQKSLILNTEDEILFNQVKGKEITAYFIEDELRRMKVEGNAESIYYAKDDDDAYIGVNKSICSEILVLFGSNEVENIKFYAQPKATMTPMGKADHLGMRLEGFNWNPNLKPKEIKDLFN
jgi:lipopolysaccharide export system protein LptA